MKREKPIIDRKHWQNTLAVTTLKASPITVKNKNKSKSPEVDPWSLEKWGQKSVNDTLTSPNTRRQRKLQSQKRICHENKILKTRAIIAQSLWDKLGEFCNLVNS